jgi:hypothetical protein
MSFTVVARMPSSPALALVTAIRVKLAPPGTLVSSTPAPVEFWIAPPLQVAALVHAPALPVTVSEPFALAVLFRTMPLGAPLEAIFWNVRSLSPTSVSTRFRARPVVLSIVFAAPVTVIAPLFAASRPLPDVVSTSRLPPVRLSVWPLLLLKMTASLAPVLRIFDEPLNVVEPPVLLAMLMPPPASLVSAIAPENVTPSTPVPPVRPVTSAVVAAVVGAVTAVSLKLPG